MDASIIEGNRAALQRLTELVERLSATDLQASLGGGWTVKAALAHLAFWDRYSDGLLADWAVNGFKTVAGSPDAINAAALSDWLELPAEHVRREVVTAATAIDQRIAALSPELAAAIEAGGRGRALDRTRHRNEHVDQIDAAVRS